MDDLRQNIADNIASLRRALGITQAELAERINYSDKAVSKWERAEAIPDITVLYELAEMFSVTVDYFLHTHDADEAPPVPKQDRKILHTVITLTSCISPYFIASIILLILSVNYPGADWLWKLFVVPLPAVFTVALVFSAIWFRSRRVIFACISALMWSIIFTVYVFIMHLPLSWQMLVIGLPLQIIILLWALFFKKKNG